MYRSKPTSMYLFCVFFTIYCCVSCTTKTTNETVSKQMQYELSTIDSLLRDSVFAQSMASLLDSSYYVGVGKAPPPFLTAQEDTALIVTNLQEEKVATRLAGFYALECAVGMLSAATNSTITSLLKRIVNGDVDSNQALILNRFSNATWKAVQPFRGLNRITLPAFKVTNLLSHDEVDRGAGQTKRAASKLLSSMAAVATDSLEQQMQALRRLVQDTGFAVEMAAFLDSSYAMNEGVESSPISTTEKGTATSKKKVKEIKIATSIAGFYALECGLDYLVARRHILPSEILKSLVNDSLSKDDKMIFARFANATWKAGQPFRGLNKITRATFTPFYFLTEADIEKDLVQVRTAAQKLLSLL